MNFGEAIKICLSKYANFNGRAIRSEYWWFYLFVLIVSSVLGAIDGVIGIRLLSSIWNLAMLVPSIAAGVRRMHDVGKSGWFLLIPFYNLYLLIIEGQRGVSNEYGPDPLSPGQEFDFERR